MKHHFLEQFYTIDKQTGDYMIEISLKDYDDIFNRWASSVYNIRDLDTSLKSFLEACSSDIDLKNNITLRFNIHNESKDPATEATVTEGIKNYFDYSLHFMKKKSFEQKKKSGAYIVISSILTFFSFYLQGVMGGKILDQIFLQALLLGGWVFLWEAFTLLFLQGRENSKKKREYKRLLAAPIKFKYKNA